MNGAAALKLICDIGVGGLGGYDGCLCTSFEVHGVHVSVSCRKSSGRNAEKIRPGFAGILVRVYSDHMDKTGKVLSAIAQRVASDLAPEGYPVMTRFCDYNSDAGQQCTYCSAPRQDAAGYLCEKCLNSPNVLGGSIAEQHDFRPYDFVLAATPQGRLAG